MIVHSMSQCFPWGVKPSGWVLRQSPSLTSVSLEGDRQMFSQSITVISQLHHLQVGRAHQQLSGVQTIGILICQMCSLSPLSMHLHPKGRASRQGGCCKTASSNRTVMETNPTQTPMAPWSTRVFLTRALEYNSERRCWTKE